MRWSEPDRSQKLLNAGSAQLLFLIHQPSREELDSFVDAARSAFNILRACVEEGEFTAPAFFLGQLNTIVGLAQMARQQKVPDEALASVQASPVKTVILQALAAHGQMRLTDLADRLDKKPQNLVTPTKELAAAGLIEREEYGRVVLLSLTPMGAAVLARLPSRRDDIGVPPPPPVRAMGAAAGVGFGGTLAGFPNRRAELHAEMRLYIETECHTVGAEPSDRQPDAAIHSARVFEQRYPGRGNPRILRSELIQTLAGSEWHLLRDPDLPLFGSDPAIYLPGVVQVIPQGLALNVLSYVNATGRFSEARVAPADAAEERLSEQVLEEIQARQSEYQIAIA